MTRTKITNSGDGKGAISDQADTEPPSEGAVVSDGDDVYVVEEVTHYTTDRERPGQDVDDVAQAEVRKLP